MKNEICEKFEKGALLHPEEKMVAWREHAQKCPICQLRISQLQKLKKINDQHELQLDSHMKHELKKALEKRMEYNYRPGWEIVFTSISGAVIVLVVCGIAYWYMQNLSRPDIPQGQKIALLPSWDNKTVKIETRVNRLRQNLKPDEYKFKQNSLSIDRKLRKLRREIARHSDDLRKEGFVSVN